MDKQACLNELLNTMDEVKKMNGNPRRPLYLSEGEAGIMRCLTKNGGSLTAGDLSEMLNVGTGRIGNALNSMEKKGLVRRDDDKNDRRITIVSLTDKGIEFSKKMQEQLMQKLSFILDRLGEEKFHEFLILFKEFMIGMALADKNMNEQE